MSKKHYTIAEINGFSQADFVRVIGPVFEHSPWVAEAAWSSRPFSSLGELHQTLCRVVTRAGEEKQLQLIRAHPDLVGRAALAGTLTQSSTEEQASAGLNKLSPEEILLFQKNNEAYRAKFDFPFIICVRLNKKSAILHGFEKRLKHTREQEIHTALKEIGNIATLRLKDLLTA